MNNIKKFENRTPRYDVPIDYTLKMDFEICSVENCHDRALITIQNCNKDYTFCENCSISFILETLPPTPKRKRLFDLIKDIIELKTYDKRAQESLHLQKKVDKMILEQDREKRKKLVRKRENDKEIIIEILSNLAKWFLVLYNFERAKKAIEIWRKSTLELKELGLIGKIGGN